jgi:hypothetical protein
VTRLGEILLARGAVSSDGLRSALDACRRQGGRLGTWLVRLGLTNEAALLEALSEQTGCPAATTLELATAPMEIRSLIPAPFAKRHLVVAFHRQGRNLDVAMANPNDLVLVDEIASQTGMVVRPHVATEAALGAALAIPIRQQGETSAPPPGPPTGAAREWRQFWRLESPATELFRALETPALPAPELRAASFPALQPLHLEERAAFVTGMEGWLDALADAHHRDQVAALVLHQLSGVALRVALFSFHMGKVTGWAIRGANVVEEDFHTLILPLDRPSVFLNLVRGVELHVGPLGGGEGNELLAEALGPPPPRSAVVAPVRVRGKVAAFLWLDRGEDTVGDIPLTLVQQVTRTTGLALEILVLRQKIRGSGRLTEGAGAD